MRSAFSLLFKTSDIEEFFIHFGVFAVGCFVLRQSCLILNFISCETDRLGGGIHIGSAALATISASISSGVEGPGGPTSFIRRSHSDL
jgi:hypothetical protein